MQGKKKEHNGNAGVRLVFVALLAMLALVVGFGLIQAGDGREERIVMGGISGLSGPNRRLWS